MKSKILLILLIVITSCKQEVPNLESIVKAQIDDIEGDIAVAYMNLSNPVDTLFINIDEEFHAASTMKVPVMIELYKQQAEGKFSLNDTILLKNEFKSIVDGSLYFMDIGDDSDDDVYNKIDQQVTLHEIMVPMITTSSNLATNVLIEIVDAKKVTQTMRDLGATKIEVLRGVEDQKAYDLGLSNSTTARDLMIIMKSIAEGKAGNANDTKEMIDILKDQKWNDMIPKYLPDGIEVAHKTGSITGVHHDAAIVYMPNNNPYVLVLLSKNLKDWDKGTDQLARISESIYNHLINN